MVVCCCYKEVQGVSWEAEFKTDELESEFIIQPESLDGLSECWELSTYTDALGVPHIRLSLTEIQDGEIWEIIHPDEDGVPLETLLPPE